MIKEFLIALEDKAGKYSKFDVVEIKAEGGNYAIYEKVNKFAVLVVDVNNSLMVKTITENVDSNHPDFPNDIETYLFNENKLIQSVDVVEDGEVIESNVVFFYKTNYLFSNEELALWESELEADFETAIQSARTNVQSSSILELK